MSYSLVELATDPTAERDHDWPRHPDSPRARWISAYHAALHGTRIPCGADRSKRLRQDPLTALGEILIAEAPR